MFWLYVLIGFAAQMIDGTMGMAYGVSCRTFLGAAAGLSAPVASAVVHCAEIPTTLVSGLSHWKLKNVSKDLLLRLVIPGVIGGVIGAFLLSGLGDKLEPFICTYLIAMGVVICIKAIRGPGETKHDMRRFLFPLGLAGGFFDAAGGGGWGPIVTSTLIATGQEAKKSIGSVNAAEFIVTVAETTAFFALIEDFAAYWPIIAGLVVGGVLAAPLAAVLCRKLPVRPLLAVVGVLIIGLNMYNLYGFFFG